MFESEGLKLRKLCKGDLCHLKKLKDESWFATHTVAIVNKCDQHRWFESLDTNVGNPRNLMMIAECDGTPVGIFKISSVEWINRTADVAWDIFQEERGKGLGKRLVAAGVDFCFSILNLRRLDAEILENNAPSQKCAEAAGFELEGRRKKAVHCREAKDSYVDSLIYGCIRA